MRTATVRRGLEAAMLGLLVACGGATPPGTRPVAGTASPLLRSVRVEQDSVIVEGRWSPIDDRATSPVLPNTVRVVCLRAERSCKEDLTRLMNERGGEPLHEAFEYRIDEWTKWGTAAGKLVAARRDGDAQIEIRVSLSGLAAEKVVVLKGNKTRWRLE